MKYMKKHIRGSATPALLVMAGAFILVIYGLLFLLTVQVEFSQRQTASEKSLHIAESGIDYYKWHLAHAPDDFEDGNPGNTGPYEHTYYDPQGDEVGAYSLEITPPSDGSSIVTIRSTGWTKELPNVKRTISAQYGIPSFARYAFLNHASSWYGSGITVNGPVHSNNGIRMDGTNLSIVSSAQETYMCGWETGCSPPTEQNGVWGAGGDQGLWDYPVPSIDFDSIAFDFSGMMTAAQDVGLYLPPSNEWGYHLVFVNDGTVNVYEVTDTDRIRGYSVPGQGLGEAGIGGCRWLYQIIADETFLGTYNIADTPIIFSESDVWLEGDVRGRVTVAAVHFPITSSNVNIWIRDNLTYTTYDGSDALGIIARNDIYLARDVPNDFRIDAVMMAQRGKIIRHGYLSSCGGTTGAVKDKLTIYGTLISYYKSYWNFGSNPVQSGFVERDITYNANMLYSPPPYFPTSGSYEFISWIEE